MTIQICTELVCFMTAKSFVSVSNIFEATRFAIIDISKLDVMFKAKCSFLKNSRMLTLSQFSIHTMTV